MVTAVVETLLLPLYRMYENISTAKDFPDGVIDHTGAAAEQKWPPIHRFTHQTRSGLDIDKVPRIFCLSKHITNLRKARKVA